MIVSRSAALHRLTTVSPKRTLRSLSSTSNYTPKPPDRTKSHEHIISQLTPLNRILCLCPVPLGRGRVSWSGGDSFHRDTMDHDATIHMNFANEQQQPKVTKYRYGERYAIGMAVSDAYLTHTEPVRMNNGREYVAEMVPSFRCDTHNLGTTPIFYTNLPHFHSELLHSINVHDIGAVVISMPMKPIGNPYSPGPTRIQLEQERKLEVVRDCIMSILQNYGQNGDEVGNDDATSNADDRLSKRLSPLGLQGFIDHRMGLAEVLSKSHDVNHGHWRHITNAIQEVQDEYAFGSNQCSQNTFTSVPAEIHAAVALNGMIEKYASAYHTTFF